MNKYVLKCGATFVLVVLMTYILSYAGSITISDGMAGTLLFFASQGLLFYALVIGVWLLWAEEFNAGIEWLLDWYLSKTR